MESSEAMLERHPVLRRLRDDLQRALDDRLTALEPVHLMERCSVDPAARAERRCDLVIVHGHVVAPSSSSTSSPTA
jgi:hypothetical protein